MKSILSSILLIILFSTIGIAQSDSTLKCGTPSLVELKEYKSFIEGLEQKIKNNQLTVAISNDSVLTIPLVFHVFHLGEPIGLGSNVSEEYIQTYVKKLNDGFRGKGNYFDKTIDSKIQFVIASRAPEGNYTNGITRHDGRVLAGYEQNGVNYLNPSTYSPLVNFSEWDTKAYININIFHSISGAGAFAGFNGSLYMQIGNVDDFESWSYAYIHEMGHSLNLYHTFEGDNNGSSCPINSNPTTDGDKIIDTPPHIRYNGTASNSINICTNQVFGKVYNNFMSYSNYATNNNYSSGQIERMRGLSFEDLTRKELLYQYGLSESNDSISVCLPSKPPVSKTFASVTLNNFLDRAFGSIHESKKNLGTIYIQPGQSYSINLSLGYYTTASSIVKLYIDTNRDGQFNEQSEVYFNSTSLYNISENIIVPNSLLRNKTYKSRLLIIPNANSTPCNLVGIQTANTMYVGKTLDADLVITPLDCSSLASNFTTTCQRIKKGDFAVIEAKNCINGQVSWFADSLKNIFISSGNRLITPSLYANTYYYASCKINNCWEKVKRATVYIDEEIANYKIESNIISAGNTTSLIFEGCINGNVNWYESEFGGVPIFIGKTLNTPIITQSTTYFAECSTSSLCVQKNRTIGKILVSSSDIVVKNSSSINFCNYNSTAFFYPIQSKVTPTYSLYSIVIIKNNQLIYQSRLQPALLNNGIIDHQIYLKDSDFPESGNYEYYVTNGNKTSQKGILTISKDFSVYTLINNSFNGYQQICNGSSTRLNGFIEYREGGEAKNNTVFSFQWYKENISINNANKAYVDVNQTGIYSVSVSYGGCTKNGYSYIDVTNFVSSNFIAADYSQNEINCQNDTIRLNSSYLTQNSTYKWFKDGIEMVGINTPSIKVSKEGIYSVQVNDPNCISNPLSTSSKNIQFNNKFNYTISASDTVICSGLNVWILLSNYSNFSKDYIIEWYKNDKLLLSGSMNYQSNRQMTTREGGKYFAIIKYKNCITKTNSIIIIENSTFQKPTIQLTNINCGTATLTASLNSDWYRNEILIGRGLNISINQTGVYKAKRNPLSNSCASTSDNLDITNLNLIPTIVTSNNKTNLCGSNDNIYLSTNYSNQYSYKWKKDNIEIPNAIYSYYFANLPGVYICEVTNGTCTSTSAPLTITQGNNLGISLSSAEQTIWCSDRSVKLTLNGQNRNITSGINWYKNGVLIPNSQSLSIFVSESGNYTASINQFNCSAITPPIPISYSNPIYNLIPSSVVEYGQSANLTVQGCNGTVKWYINYEDNEYAATGVNYITPPLFQNTIYYVSCEEGSCLSSKIPANILVCSSSLIFSTNILSGIYKASDSIEANIYVPSNTVFSAAKKIILKPGFQADTNKVFEAKIGGCNN